MANAQVNSGSQLEETEDGALRLRRNSSLVVHFKNTFRGLFLVIALPFILAIGIVYLLGLTARLALDRPTKTYPVNTTPCGRLCSYARWNEADLDWHCQASQGHPVDFARKGFRKKEDPNNCTMFQPSSYRGERDG